MNHTKTLRDTSRQWLTLLLALLVAPLLTGHSALRAAEHVVATPAPAPGEGITATAMDIARQMYPGWNLGNTMEAGNWADNYRNAGIDTETSWQTAVTTQSLIDYVSQQGFRSVRIPSAWLMGHVTDSATVTIDPAWMDRVAQIVDYCLADGLYVFINDHWDGGWLEDSFGDTSEAAVQRNSATLRRLWTQIATRFRDYDEHLLFAGLNEPYVHGTVDSAMVSALVSYEQVFIDAVRATGGNNATRTLIVQGPQTDIDKTLQYYDISRLSDPAGPGRLMLEVHFYAPWNLAGMERDESWGQTFYYWGTPNHLASSIHNATYGEEEWLKSQFDRMKSRFADHGIPVIVGEYGCLWRDITGLEAESQALHDASVRRFHETVNQWAPSCGMVPFVWDINYCKRNSTAGTYTLFDREGQEVFCQPAIDGIRAGTKAAQWPY